MDPAYLVVEGGEELVFKATPETLMMGKLRLIVNPYSKNSSFRCYYFNESASEYSYGIALKISSEGQQMSHGLFRDGLFL